MSDLDVNDYVRGQEACHDGIECPSDASESFKQGYSDQYGLEQTKDSMSGFNHEFE